MDRVFLIPLPEESAFERWWFTDFGAKQMTDVPQVPLIPNNSLITPSPEEGRALAIMMARHTVHATQKELEVLVSGRAQYSHDPYGLIAVAHVVAVEFATIAAANNYWRKN